MSSAAGGDDPLLEIHVTGDWSEFDRQAQQREAALAGRDFTFGTEGRARGGSNAYQLPAPSQYVLPSPSQSSFAPSGLGLQSVAQAAEQMVNVFVRQLTVSMQQVAPQLDFSRALALRPSQGLVRSGYDFSATEAEWVPSAGGYGRLARTAGYRRPEVPWEEAEWAPYSRPAQRLLVDRSTRGLMKVPARGGAPETIEAEWEAIPRPGAEAGLMDPRTPQYGFAQDESGAWTYTGGFGPGGSAPGSGGRMYVPTGMPGGGRQGWFGGGQPFGPGFMGRGGGGGGGAGGGGGGIGGMLGGAANWAQENFSRRGMFTILFGLWELHRAMEAERQMNASIAGAQTPQDLMKIYEQGIRGETSGLFAGTFDIFASAAGHGTRQTLDLIQGEQIRSDTLDRTQNNLIGVANQRAIMAATPLGLNAVAAVQSRIERQKVERDAYQRIGTINMLLAGHHAQTNYGTVLGLGVGGTLLGGPLLGAAALGVGALTGSLRTETNDVADPSQRSALATERRSLRDQIQAARDKEQFDAAERAKDTALVRYDLASQARVFAAMLPGTTVQQAELVSITERQNRDLQRVIRFTPELLQETISANAGELNAAIYGQGLQTRVAELATRGFVRESGYGSRFPYQRQRQRIIDEAAVALEENERNPQEQGRIRRRRDAALREAELEEYHEYGLAMITQGIGQQALRAGLTGDVKQMRRLQLIQRQTDQINRIPLDRPDLIKAQGTTNVLEQQLLERQFKVERYMETYGLQGEEEYTHQLAGAVGPGARQKRLQAEIYRLTRSAEGRAESRLFQDSTDMQNADRERRIGINQLGAFRAQYLEGFRAQEGSLYRTNLSNTATGSPSEVLHSIDAGIKELTRKVGTLVAVK